MLMCAKHKHACLQAALTTARLLETAAADMLASAYGRLMCGAVVQDAASGMLATWGLRW
jgi:hypothetical protein